MTFLGSFFVIILFVIAVALIVILLHYKYKGRGQARRPKRVPPVGEQQAQQAAGKQAARTVDEGSQLVPEKITLPQIAGQTPPSMVEGIQTAQVQRTEGRATEEREQKMTGETQSRGEDEVRSKVTASPIVSKKDRPREPLKRGGKPRGRTREPEKERAQGNRPRHTKPEIVCWKRERQWMLAVEVPEELLEKSNLVILQTNSLLQRDEWEEVCWRLNHVSGDVIIRWSDDDSSKEAKVELGHNDHLLFKLSGQSLDRGRFVKVPSAGSYLVIVPEDWRRDEVLSGSPPAMPEPVDLPGYQAHFFDLEKGDDQKIAFQLPNGQPRVIEAKAPRFELIGSRLGDASEYMGPLFGEGPPRIRALDAHVWNSVGTIVVGEEGRGRGRWRMSFSPDLGQVEQDLPSEVADRKGGWYFLRFYNSDDDLIESIDFRFLSVLREIRLRQPPHLPAGNGYQPACVEFLHETDCVVQPASNLTNIQVECQDDKTILSIPPDPTCDESQWLVGPKRGPQVEVTINVERIWWAIGEENNPPDKWQDRPLLLSREDFKATSSKTLWLRLPRCRWVDKIFVGFERSSARPYAVKVTDRAVAIPLREYGDCPEVEDQTQEYNLKLWGKDSEGILAVLPISQKRVAPAPVQAMPSPSIDFWRGAARKKTAVATAAMREGSGKITVKGQLVDDYFRQAPRQAKQFLERLRNLEKVKDVLAKVEVDVTVRGSSPTTMRQAKAVAHAIARALMSFDPRLTSLLRQAGFGGVRLRGSEPGKRGKR